MNKNVESASTMHTLRIKWGGAIFDPSKEALNECFKTQRGMIDKRAETINAKSTISNHNWPPHWQKQSYNSGYKCTDTRLVKFVREGSLWSAYSFTNITNICIC